MSRTWRVAWAIARRDYIAAVFSRLFLVFLLLPLIFGLIGAAFGAIGSHDDDGTRKVAVVAVSGDGAAFEALSAARARVSKQISYDVLPPLVRRDGDPHDLPKGDIAAVLTGGLQAPRLILAADAPGELAGQMSLLIEQARVADAITGAAQPALAVKREPAAAASHDNEDRDRLKLARTAQYAVIVLTIMLGGRLLSSFIEERSNKVIEVLAAVAPIDAIFLGKLLGMLLFSLTCVLGWGAIGLSGTLALAPQMLAAIPTPAIGWLFYAPLLLIYFGLCFLLFGAIMLGLGAQANSPSDVQTLALPMTISQLMTFGLASIDVARPDHWIAHAAAIFPWSSPLAMLARGAELPVLWPHLIAILWQAGWLALTIRLAAGRFRRAVLKSGGGRKAKA